MINIYNSIGTALANCDDIAYIDIEGAKVKTEIYPSALIKLADATYTNLQGDNYTGEIPFKVSIRTKPFISTQIKPEPPEDVKTSLIDYFEFINEARSLILAISDDYICGVQLLKESINWDGSLMLITMQFTAQCAVEG